MKRQTLVFTIFLLTTSIVCGQKPKTNNSIISQLETIDSLKKAVGQKWIRQNPVLNKTKSSFFNKDNESKYFVGLLKISGQSVPFTWDDDFSIVQFILTLDNEPVIKRGFAADSYFKGTKFIWKNKINGLVWFNDKSYKATVDNWHLSDLSECPGTIIFPNLSFKKIAEIPNAITNDILGLTILPYQDGITVKSAETFVKTESGKTIKGIGYDLNNDAIFDIFSYSEEINETERYTRLYMNVNGQWKCKWINLDEVCI